jgi:alcohol dehydrogenase, propanol-preferring
MAMMQAMQLDAAGTTLRLIERPLAEPKANEVLIEVHACGVCRTDLHVVDGDLQGPLPIIPGHEVVGHVVGLGAEVENTSIGDRIGVPWLGGACGACSYCRSGRENLCDTPDFTGFTRDGGFATHCLADARFCLPIPASFSDVEAAPLLCAGLIGYRSLKAAGEGSPLGLYGFGAAAHIIAQVARHHGREVYAFVTPGDRQAVEFALEVGVDWAGFSNQPPPHALDNAMIFAPVGTLVPEALSRVKRGGVVVCAGIHMSDIPSFPYRLLWEERTVRSVANLTREDAREFLQVAATMPLQMRVRKYTLADANQALDDLRSGHLSGAAVIVP